MRCMLLIYLISVALFQQAVAQDNPFSDGPVFVDGDVPCDDIYAQGTICRELAAPFSYMKDGLGWEAAPGLITDGASIPHWAQWLIGKPYDEDFAKAATLHDHYCREEHHVRDYLSTQRMFYNALIDSGVDGVKAGVMYAAVLVGAPKWTQVVPGKQCTNIKGEICVRTTVTPVPGVALSTNNIEAKYDELPMEDLTREFQRRIVSEDLSPEQIEEMALAYRVRLGYELPSLAIRQQAGDAAIQ
ncbi:MAG: DUF1353 domain-containing protein [Devosia sp.]